MMKLFVLAMVFMVPVVVSAQGSGSIEPPPRTSPNESANREDNFVVTRSETGTIVGLKEGILTIKTKKDKEISVALANSTTFRIGKNKIDSDELAEGMFEPGKQVKITYRPFSDRKSRVDKVAVEVRFNDEKDKQKPVISG